MEEVTRQVSRWLHDERSCVTVQRIVQTFELPWSLALSVLKGTPVEGRQYYVIRFATNKGSGTDGSVCGE